jgi:hypothetical protein
VLRECGHDVNREAIRLRHIDRDEINLAFHKHFSQRRPDGKGGVIWNLNETRRVLYHLDEVARDPEATVYITEGEKDADRLRALGLGIVTTNPGGAGKWRDSYSQTLARNNCVLFYDNDPETIKFPGQLHAAHVARSLLNQGCTVRLVHLPDGFKDVLDYLKAGHDRDDLIPLIDASAPLTLASLATWESQFAPNSGTGNGTAGQAGEDWRNNLLRSQKGFILANLTNAVVALQSGEWPESVRWNSFAVRVESNRGEWTDAGTTGATIWLQNQGVNVNSAVTGEAILYHYCPANEFWHGENSCLY